MKKKFVSVVMAALMVAALTAGCGGSESETSDNTSKESNTATDSRTDTDATDDAENKSETPDPETADAPEQVYVPDYDELDAWISYGFKGTGASGEEILLGINADSNYGILIISDDSDKTFVSYAGTYTNSYDDSVDYGYITIADKINYGYKELADGELEIDAGDLGVVRVATMTQPIIMNRIKELIEDYTNAS